MIAVAVNRWSPRRVAARERRISWGSFSSDFGQDRVQMEDRTHGDSGDPTNAHHRGQGATWAETIGIPTQGGSAWGVFNPFNFFKLPNPGGGLPIPGINWKLAALGVVGLVVGGWVLVKVVGALAPVAGQAIGVSLNPAHAIKGFIPVG